MGSVVGQQESIAREEIERGCLLMAEGGGLGGNICC